MPHAQRNGVDIFFETYGQGTPLVFLHPIAANRFIWQSQLFAFARTHRVIVLDQRGHGLSSRPTTGYGVDELSRDLLCVLDAAGVDRAILVGNSVGGMVAVQTALEAGERVSALMIVSSATNLAPLVPAAVFEAYEARFEAAWAYMSQGSTSARTKRERPEVIAYLDAVWRVPETFQSHVFLESMRDPNGVFHWNAEDRLGSIQVPTMVLGGEEDQTMPLAATRLLAERIPNARFKAIPEVGHYYEIERPADFNEDLRAFLAELAPAA